MTDKNTPTFDDNEWVDAQIDPASAAPWPRASSDQPGDGIDRQQLLRDDTAAQLRQRLHDKQVEERAALINRHNTELKAAGFEPAEPIKTFAPVNITVNLDELMQYFGMEYDDEGPTGAPNKDIKHQVMVMVADKLLNQVIGSDNTFKDHLNALISARLGVILTETLERRFRPMDWMGQPKGEPTTLAEIIGEEAKTHLANAMAETNSRDPYSTKGAVRKFVRDEVSRQFEAELKGTLADAKAVVLKAVTDKGAEFLTQAFADAATKVQAAVPSKTI